MTIQKCENCGGTNYGVHKCLFVKAPCVEIQVFPPGLVSMIDGVLIIAREGMTTQKEVSRRLGRTTRYFEAQSLVRAGIAGAKTGPDGGLWLAKPADEITVGDLARVCFKALESSARSKGPRGRTRKEQHSDLPILRLMRSRMIAEMDAVTIADLLDGEEAYFARKRYAALAALSP